MSEITKSRRRRRPRSEVQARSAEAFALWMSGLSFRDIDKRMDFGGSGNTWRAVQAFLGTAPDAGPVSDRRKIEGHRLDDVWRMAHAIASDVEQSGQVRVMALRVLLETSRRRSKLEGLDKPTVLQIDGPQDTQQAAGPTLREVLPPEVVALPRAVREQALALHRALPAGQSEVG